MLEVLKSLFGIIAMVGKTSLFFDSNRSVEITAGAAVNGGVTVQGLRVVDGGKSQWFEFIGAGGGVGIGLPVSGSFSDETFETWG